MKNGSFVVGGNSFLLLLICEALPRTCLTRFTNLFSLLCILFNHLLDSFNYLPMRNKYERKLISSTEEVSANMLCVILKQAIVRLI